MRAVAYSQKGDLDLAIADFDRALKINSKFAEAHFNKALACEQAGRAGEAPAAYKSFLQYAAPENDRQAHFARERIKALESPSRTDAQVRAGSSRTRCSRSCPHFSSELQPPQGPAIKFSKVLKNSCRISEIKLVPQTGEL